MNNDKIAIIAFAIVFVIFGLIFFIMYNYGGFKHPHDVEKDVAGMKIVATLAEFNLVRCATVRNTNDFSVTIREVWIFHGESTVSIYSIAPNEEKKYEPGTQRCLSSQWGYYINDTLGRTIGYWKWKDF